MTITATFTKIQDAPQVGTYSPTAIDEQKKEAQILLLQCSPKIVDSKIELKGRGIKALSVNGRYQISDNAWVKIQAQYTTQTNF